jgi:hypothetical protein
MGSTHPHPNVLLFGDVTDAWIDGMDYIFAQATTTPWLRSFLRDLFSAFETEVSAMDSYLQGSFGVGACSSFEELVQKYRHTEDQVGMVHAMLLYTVRAALMLQYVTHVSFISTFCMTAFADADRSTCKELHTAIRCFSLAETRANLMPTHTYSVSLAVYGMP